MSEFSEVNKCFQACVTNAERHVVAAKDLRAAGHNNMAFNAAVLALEEIGKAVLIVMSGLHANSKEPEFVREDWIEDHTKKLFWALWTMTFGRADDTAQDFQDFPHVASRIHLRRLRAIYVDPSSGNLPEQIPDEDVDGMVALAEYRIKAEKDASFNEPDEKDRPDLDWFMRAANDPKLAGVIFGKDSFGRLKSFGGNVREWVRWLRTEIDRLEGYNQRLAEEELARVPPPDSDNDVLKPKWRLKVRLRSWSHSIRGKSLTSWNKKSKFVKLSAAHKHQELIVEFLVPKKVLFADLWAAGSTAANSFVLALNIATRGFFWWYLPAKTASFFEEIRDLERNEPLTINAPNLTVGWGNLSLSEDDMENALRAYAYLRGLARDKWEPYLIYLQGLALVAKNDIHGRFEPTILQLFYEAFRRCAQQHGAWDGASPFIDAAKKGLDVFSDRMDSIDRELPRLVQLGDAALAGTVTHELPIKDAILMKLFCDLYFSRLVLEVFDSRSAAAQKAASADASSSG